MIGQRKTFCKQGIPSLARKKAVDKDILVTPRNGDRKTIQFTRITSRAATRTRKRRQFRHFR